MLQRKDLFLKLVAEARNFGSRFTLEIDGIALTTTGGEEEKGVMKKEVKCFKLFQLFKHTPVPSDARAPRTQPNT